MEVFFLMLASVFAVPLYDMLESDDSEDEPETAPTGDWNPQDLSNYVPENYSGEFTGTDAAEASDGASLTEDHAFFLLAGNDTLSGTDGNDYADAGDGEDDLSMGSGDDIARGGAGEDTILGGIGEDTLFGDAGGDFIDGGKSNDTISGGDGDDTIIGGNSSDSIEGGAGNDVLYSDLASADATVFDGADSLFGGEGDDTLYLAGNDFGTGGENSDTFNINSAAQPNAVATILDFSPSEDMIIIEYDEEPGEPTPTLSTSISDDGISTVISLDGIEVGIVSGVTGLTVSDIILVPSA